jgi:hypothetical protein
MRNTKRTKPILSIWKQLESLGLTIDLDDAIKRGEFDEKRYLAEGPDKHMQEDHSVHTVGMYGNWAAKFLEKWDPNWQSRQAIRWVAEYLYQETGHGLFENKKAHWDLEFENTEPLPKKR